MILLALLGGKPFACYLCSTAGFVKVIEVNSMLAFLKYQKIGLY